MVDQQLNNKMMNTDSYRMLRLLKTSAEFVRIYQANIKEVKNPDSVVIFPEQVLCLEDQKIICVNHSFNSELCSVTISRHTKPVLVGRYGNRYTLEQIFEREYEAKTNVDVRGSFMISTAESTNYIQFFSSPTTSGSKFWFTNERAAIKFANRKLKL